MHQTAILIFIAILFVVVPDASAQTLSPEQRATLLSEAQHSYDRGVAARRDDPALARRMFQNAISRFEQLVDDGVVNGSLQYNLANAYLQTGALGQAILHYRAGETLIPGDAALQHNLDYARSLRRSKIDRSGERALADALLSWHTGVSLRTRAYWFSALYCLFWTCMFIQMFRPAAVWKWAAGGLSLGALILGISNARDLLVDEAACYGVVLRDDVIVRKGNGIGFEPQFLESLSEGVEFALLDRRTGWLHIELPDGKTGWIAEDTAGLLRDALHGSLNDGTEI